MKKIPLTQGKYAIVDDIDFEYLNQWKWTFHNLEYAYRKDSKDNRKNILMHRAILKTPTGKLTDHVNGNGLDNRRGNLRVCTSSQNQKNQRKNKANTSGFKGVSWDKERKKWAAYINANGRLYHLGRFSIKRVAAEAYDKAAKKLHGEFARLNFA